MWFTEAEAKAQDGKWVRVRDASLWLERIDQGAHGTVVSTQPVQPGPSGREEAGWGICLEVYLSRDHALSVLLHQVSKAQYVATFEEIAAKSSPRTTRLPSCAHVLPRQSALARRVTLTVVASNGRTKQAPAGEGSEPAGSQGA